MAHTLRSLPVAVWHGPHHIRRKLQVHSRAQIAGPLALRDGTQQPPTGKRIQIKGMELAQLRDGKISAHRMYWDGLAIARQLGLLPERTTA